jgi:Spy/CpxP family protein refolding chaperone
MKSRKIKSAAALLFGLLLVTAVQAQPRQGGRGSGPGGDGDSFGHRLAWLDLSETQEEEITSLRTQHYKEITPMRNKMAELKARERTLLSEESVDMKAVEKNIDEQTDLMNSMKKMRTKHQLAIKDVLSDEQVMKLQQRRQFARGEGFHGKGNRGGNHSHMGRMGRGYRMN